MKKKYILAIETSCDETSIAIVDQDINVISHVTNTQIEFFKEIGGVVPEMASRMHVDNILYVYDQCLNEAEMTIDEIDAIAVTVGPGLNGSLLIGVNFAKTLSLLHHKKLIGVNHLHGHIHALDIEHDVTYPHMSLIVSGGHTELIYMQTASSYQKIGGTHDDAAGECFDKIARILNVGYPGGPVIDKMAKKGKNTYDLPFPMNDKSLDFSFSGIKTAAYNINNQLLMKNEVLRKNDFACSFQSKVVEILLTKLKAATELYDVKSISIVGGVSANSELKAKAFELFPQLMIPNIKYCTDNGAMIGAAAWIKYNNNEFLDPFSVDANPNLKVGE